MGIHVNQSWYSDIPIHDSLLPEKYQQLEHVIKCVNYTDSNQVSDFDPYNSNFDGTMSQITTVGTQMSDDRDTFGCSLFRLTCNCGMSKKVNAYMCR